VPVENVIIIGGGPAAYTAALYLARAGLDPLCVEGYAAGGQLLTTTTVDNFPGFPEGIAGPDLMTQMRAQAERLQTRFLMEDAIAVDVTSRPFTVTTPSGTFQSESLILATGATAKTLGLPSEEALQNRGVAYCAVCDGPLFTGQRIAVVGGGDAALTEAMYLTTFATEVVVIHRRHEFRAANIMVEQAGQYENLSLLVPWVVERVLGEEAGRLSGVLLRNTETGEERIEELGALFVAIGHHPNTDLVAGQVECDGHGYVIVEPGRTSTSVPGVFAAGDVQDPVFRQAITSAGSGCMAALEAQRWLAQGRPTGRRSDPKRDERLGDRVSG
jgi:thioredoxin reductase (NADPH)